MKRITFLMLCGLLVINLSCKKSEAVKSPSKITTENPGKTLFSSGEQPFKWAKVISSLSGLLDMKIDDKGNFYLFNQGAYTQGTPEYDQSPYYTTIVKLDSSGNQLWQTTVPVIMYKIALDKDGNVYSYSNESAPDYGTSGNFSELLYKFDSGSGNISLKKVVAGGNSFPGHPTTDLDDIGVDAQGNIFLIGLYMNSPDLDPGPGECKAAGNGTFLLKLSPDGATRFVTGDKLKNGLTYATLTVNPDGSVAFCGLAEVNGTSHVQVEAYTSNGTFNWSKSIDLLKPNVGGLQFITCNDFAYYLGAGYIFNANVAYQYTLYKIDKSGHLIYQANTASWIPRNSMAADPYGNIYFTGSFSKAYYGDPNSDNPDFDPRLSIYKLPEPVGQDIYIDEYDKGGNFRGAISFRTSNPHYQNDAGQKIIADKKGNLFLCGIFDSPIDFDPTAGVSVLNPTSLGVPNVFLVKLAQHK